ncbi:MAG: hypothetical protein JJ863_08655 [Deltaproteobacteria bacterium]|nr:hypothetical protein [Deltaproteobacteria bacterium]
MRLRFSVLMACLFLVACGDDAMPMPDGGDGCTADSECDDGIFCNGPESCSAGVCMPGDPPCLECEETTDSCATDCPDNDRDGHEDIACGGDDCDDDDPDRYPGNIEVCGGRDFHDEDCDPTTFGSDGDRDGDGEISSLCCNPSGCGGDCNDNDITVLSGQIEICDSKDNDCDGDVDEDPNEVDWYPDTDMDLFGDPDRTPVTSCTPIPDHSIRPFDCDDTRSTVNPAAIEQCNDLDDDCDGTIDEDLPECSPCDPNPCANDGLCRTRGETMFLCECSTGFVGTTCTDTCDVVPAYPEAPEGRATEVNHVRDARLFIDSHRDDGMVATCDGPCLSAFAADGQRCGDDTKAPVAYSAVVDAGQRWVADWSLRGAKRIDRIEVYPVRGDEAEGLNGAEILVDGVVVDTYPDGATEHAVVFDPPIYGSSIEVRKTTGSQLLGLAEVEAWGEREAPITNVALHGAARQSSILANESNGIPFDTSAFRAVDGRGDTAAATKPFARSGTLSLEGQVAPYGTGNQDEAPMVGRNSAWWWLDLGRGQRVRSIQIHRGPNADRLDAAEVFLAIGGTLDASPRWTLPTGGSPIEVLRPSAPIANVTGVKVVSALASTPPPGAPEASLEMSEVRVWADTPGRGSEPLRDLSTVARVDFSGPPSGLASLNVLPGMAVDGDPSTFSSSINPFAFLQLRFDDEVSIESLHFLKRMNYPSGFFCCGHHACPNRQLCGDTYGGCMYRPAGSVVTLTDEGGAPIGAPVGDIGYEFVESMSAGGTSARVVDVTKVGGHLTFTSTCTIGYPSENGVGFAELQPFGYWGPAGPLPMDYALATRPASVSIRPAAGTGFEAERAFDGWNGDSAAAASDPDQELLVVLRRPLLVEGLEIRGPRTETVREAVVEVLVDGGRWQEVTILPGRAAHTLSLSGDRLIAAVRLRKSGSSLEVQQLRVLAVPRY